MAGKVFHAALTFAIRILSRGGDLPSSESDRTPVVKIDFFYPHHDRALAGARGRIASRYNNAAVPKLQLSAVIGNLQPQRESKCAAQPVYGLPNIRIIKHRNDA